MSEGCDGSEVMSSRWLDVMQELVSIRQLRGTKMNKFIRRLRLRIKFLHPKYSVFFSLVRNKIILRRKLNKYMEYWKDKSGEPLCIKCNTPMEKGESLEMEMKYPDIEGFRCVTDRFIFLRPKTTLPQLDYIR